MTDEQLRNLRILAERAANVFWGLDVIAEDLDKTEATPARDFVEAANPGLILEMADTIATLRHENAQLNTLADWLAKNGQGEDQCPYLAFYRDSAENCRPQWCGCLDNDEEFDCDEYVPDCWRKAACDAVEAQK